jgi:8-oxo-dGTP pyrophosphatase MutT (NUDIX family)
LRSSARGWLTAWLVGTFGGLYNDLIGRRSHLGVAAVIFNQQGRVLLIRQSYGHRAWDLPGGGRERRESLEEALRRELREEIDVELASAELCGVYFEPGVDQHHFAFRCDLTPGVLPRAKPPEIVELGYFSADALPRPINDFTQQRIKDALARTEPKTLKVLGPRGWHE